MEKDELITLLKKYGLWAKKGLGQNFLIDEKALAMIVESADLKLSDVVAEVGPGTGVLTERLIDKAERVVAVEKDKEMVRVLQDRFVDAENLEIVEGDVLKIRTKDHGLRAKQYKVVANIPYYITSPLLKHFLHADIRPSLMVLLVQKEVAEKICGISGKSMITIQTQVFAKPEIVGIVPSSSFYPAPKVDSAILKLSVYDTPLVSENGLKDFFRIVKFGFANKRKKLSNTLGAGLHIKPSEMAEKLRSLGIDPDLRAENLEIEDWKKLVKL